jgi:hypothetical protein
MPFGSAGSMATVSFSEEQKDLRPGSSFFERTLVEGIDEN